MAALVRCGTTQKPIPNKDLGKTWRCESHLIASVPAPRPTSSPAEVLQILRLRRDAVAGAVAARGVGRDEAPAVPLPRLGGREGREVVLGEGARKVVRLGARVAR